MSCIIRAFLLLGLILSGASQDAHPAINHGVNTTLDLTSFGGNWTCIRSVASGTCGGATTQFFNAACDGSTVDSAAFASWVAYGVSKGATNANLYIPPGSHCVLDSGGTNGCLTNDCSTHGTAGVQQPNIWGYGAIIDQACRVGGWGFFDNNTSQALVNTVSAGATSVTVNDGNIGRFSVGNWIVITALGIQSFGDPPNFAYFEYKQIAAISGNVVSFSSPLKNSYKSTYPQLDTGSPTTPSLGGPAQIYLLEPSWNVTANIFGLTLHCVAQQQFVGRNIMLQSVNVSGTSGSDFSTGIVHTINSSSLGSVEYDKDLELGNFYAVTTGQFIIQSQSGALNIVGSTLNGALNGTTANTAVTSTTIIPVTGGIRAGPTCCGAGTALYLNGVSFTPARTNAHHTLVSAYSLSGGVLTIAKASSEYSTSVSMWVPGHKYYLGDNQGFNDCVPVTPFTVSDVIDAGSNVQIITDLASIPGGNICNNNNSPVVTFASYGVLSLIQTNSGPGNMLSIPEAAP